MINHFYLIHNNLIYQYLKSNYRNPQNRYLTIYQKDNYYTVLMILTPIQGYCNNYFWINYYSNLYIIPILLYF